MNTYISFIILLIPAALFLVAAWPLLLLPRVRPAIAGLSGTGCVGLGSTLVALLAGGAIQLPASTALAQSAESTPAESATAKAESDPVIETPLTTVEIPSGRPDWVGSEPNFRGRVHTIAVSSGPYATEAQAKRALDEALVKATNEYIADQLGSQLAPTLIRFDARTIKKRFVNEDHQYHDTARYGDPVGWMHENFAMLEFGPDFRNDLDRRWTKVRATSRLAQTGLVSGGVLLLLSSVFGYFRLDNATRGYYTGRLQFMTAAAILAVVGAGAVISQWIHWL